YGMARQSGRIHGGRRRPEYRPDGSGMQCGGKQAGQPPVLCGNALHQSACCVMEGARCRKAVAPDAKVRPEGWLAAACSRGLVSFGENELALTGNAQVVGLATVA